MVKTGSTKYQKFLKSEKAKVKLKAKKDLPKGTNVTKTNFKIKKIVIREQLKATGKDEPLSSRKLNLKDLLSKLNHFNTSAKADAINGIKELLSNRDILDLHLDQLIRGVVPLVMDVEKLIRRECFKLLHTILGAFSPEKLEPFMEILLSYLRCAMTHINQNIQEDSLLFLDVLLIGTPFHVAANYQSIMPNFIDMISKLRIDSKPGRMLIVNLDSKMTSVKWRVKVLNRLHQFFSIIVRTKKDNDKNILRDVSAHLDKKTVVYEKLKPYVSLFDESYLANCSLPCYSSHRHNDITKLSETEAFQSYIEVLAPLLFETWLEVGSGYNKNGSNKNESMLSDDSADLLGNILEVMQLLLVHVQHISEKAKNEELVNFFIKKCRQSFLQHILSHFPFVRSKRGWNKKKVLAPLKDDRMLLENLAVCYIFISLHKSIAAEEQHAKTVIQYLVQNFNSFNDTQVREIHVHVLEILFATDVTWENSLHHVESLLNEILSFYKSTDDTLRQQYFSVLCSLFINSRHHSLCSLPSYQEWLYELPRILCSERVSTQTIQILNKFAVQCNKQLNSSINGRLLSVISNLPKIHKSYGNDVTAKHQLLSLLYWFKCWDNESLNLLQQQLGDNMYEENCNFILDILKIKTQST